MEKKIRYVLYAIIVAICVMAIFVGVFALIFRDMGPTKVGENATDEPNEIEDSESKKEFLSLFENQFYASSIEEQGIKKMDDSKPMVYDAIQFNQSVDNKYDFDIHIPQINIDSDLARKYNNMTQEIFLNKLNEVLAKAEEEENKNQNTVENEVEVPSENTIFNSGDDEKEENKTTENTVINETEEQESDDLKFTMCNISFTAYVNNNILSVAILEKIKEGDSAQRNLVQTYNYNLETNEEVKIDDILKLRGLEEDAVKNKIDEEINKMIEDSTVMEASGYKIYKRDIDSDLYKVENAGIFIQGPNGELYIIYPYGNVEDTSALDVVKI